MDRHALATLNADGWLLFATRSVRMFAYGLLSVVLVLYLASLGFDNARIGLLLALTLLGDTGLSLAMTLWADRLGRRKMLLVGALLMAAAGAAFAVTRDFHWLLAAAIVGVISPGGKEVGPFLSIEQACLSQLIADERRTDVFAWYNLVGSLAAALGAFAGGAALEGMKGLGVTGPAAFRPIILGYGVAGLLLAGLFLGVSARVETVRRPEARAGLHRSRRTVFKLSALFALDALGGGFVIDGITAYWLVLEFNAEPITLGVIYFWANLFAGLSGLVAARLARRFGLLNTMIFTHLPSNVLLLLVPLMPSLGWAVAVLLARFAISQMDVPTRQSYVMAVVDPTERSAAAGVTGVARSLGAAISPLFVGLLLAHPATRSMPFFLAGGLKIVYDLWLYREFAAARPNEAAG